jgi:hypothetical protein
MFENEDLLAVVALDYVDEYTLLRLYANCTPFVDDDKWPPGPIEMAREAFEMLANTYPELQAIHGGFAVSDVDGISWHGGRCPKCGHEACHCVSGLRLCDLNGGADEQPVP